MKRKIAVIGLKGLPAFGGAATTGENIINQLKNKYDFTVYSITSYTRLNWHPFDFNQIVFKDNKNHQINLFLYYFKSSFYCLFKSGFDIIHLHHSLSGLFLPLLKLKYKIIITLHGSGDNAQNYDKLGWFGKKYFIFSEYLSLKFSDIVVTVSIPHIQYYKQILNRKIEYIPNGIDTSGKVISREIKFDNYILFSASRIIKIKGCHLLLEALHKLNFTGKVLIIGDTNQNLTYKEELINLSKNLDVEYLGLLKDKELLMAYLRHAKLFVFPSLIEAMSNMLLEAASMKAPIICSDIRENKAIFNENEVTFFRSGDSDDLSNKIRWALDNKIMLKIKTEKAYNKLKNEYSWENIASKYDELYQQLLSKV